MKFKLTEQSWTFYGITASFDYEEQYWTISRTSRHSLQGLAFGKPSQKSAKAAIKYAITNNII